MDKVPVRIHCSDAEEVGNAERALVDAEATEVQRYDGMIEAAIPQEQVAGLLDKKLLCDFPQGIKSPRATLAANTVSEDELFPHLRPSSQTKDRILNDFTRRSRRVGTRKKASGLRILSSVRRTANPILDGVKMEGRLPRDEDLLDEDAYLIRFSANLRPEWRAELERVGVELMTFQPPFIYRAMLNRRQLKVVQGMVFVKAVRRYGLRETVTPAMLDLLKKTAKSHRNTTIKDSKPQISQFDVTVHRKRDMNGVKRLLASTPGVKILKRGRMALRFQMDPQSPVLATLANLPVVHTLTPFQPPQLSRDRALEIIGVNAINSPPTSSWTGSGETIAMFDSGVDAYHPDLQHCHLEQLKYGTCSKDDRIGHGTHVAGILVGDDRGGTPPGRGIAPGAKLVSVGIVNSDGKLDVPPDLARQLELAIEHDAKIINLSWGFALSGDYEVYGESIDRFAREHPDVLVVVAAGNEGRAPAGKHLPQTIGQPAGAKNVLTVGASASDRSGNMTWGQLNGEKFPSPPAMNEPVTGNKDLPAGISSRGPTDFQSVKPDVLAPGTMILSARASKAMRNYYVGVYSNPHYGYLSGTSMSAPAVAGAAAIVREYLRVQCQMPNPSSALLKALLILSARRIPIAGVHAAVAGIGYPDFDQGFGRVDLREILPHAGAPAARRLVFDDVPNDSPMALISYEPVGAPRRSQRNYWITLNNDSNLPLRVVLVWTDVSGRFVQNSLEFRIHTPDGRRFVGNQSLTAFHLNWEREANITPVDRHNNVQIVSIDTPVNGRYKIIVLAADTPFPPQGYALAICGECADGFQIP